MKYISALLLPLMILLWTYETSADPHIAHIKKLYGEAKELECGYGCQHFMHEIKINTMRAVIGLQTTKIRFYFSSFQSSPEKDPYATSYELKKVTVDYNIAASVVIHMEYLFDEKGRPVFHFWKEKTSGNREETKRYYFYGNKLIKVIMDYDTPQGDPVKYTHDRNFKSGDIKQGRNIITKALNYKRLFNSIIEADSWK